MGGWSLLNGAVGGASMNDGGGGGGSCESVSDANWLFVNTPGRTEIVETLLDAGMDPNCFDGASGRN